MSYELKRDDSFQAPAELAKALWPYGSAMTHPAKKILFARGEKAHGLFLLISGSARLNIPGARDRSVGAGSLLGVPGTLSRGIYSLSAELLEESQVLFVPSERVSSLLEANPAVGFQIVQLLSREVQAVRQRIADLDNEKLIP
jgi:CRP-like cAMP-binding protein